MNLMQVIEACEARICGGAEYQWICYGENARYLDFSDRDGTDCASVIFDTKTQVVYELHMNVPGYDQAFGWHNPDFQGAYVKECKRRDVEPDVAWDQVYYQQVDENTALDYLQDIIGTYYDNLPIPESA